jgi:hypothetical protein
VWTAPPRGRPRSKQPEPRPTPTQLEWLRRGLDRAGGSLPIFDTEGQQISSRTVKSCVDRGWAERKDKLTRDWQLCQLTPAGRRMLEAE